MADGVVDEQRVLQGRYRLKGPLARGGMAEVWEGVDEVLTRSIAVKLLHRHLAADEELRERFRREAVAAARLAHPNVVATFDTGEDDGVPFIVMELVRGPTLRTALNDQKLRPAVAAAVAIQVADALQAAHEAGIVHRDVKPGNILLCEGVALGAPASVKVADFGIARAVDMTDSADLTKPGTLLGTTKYLSPEQVRGEDPDARSDVYSLGVVLYEMLTGKPPFDADTAVATAIAHVQSEPLKPRQLRAGIPRALEQVVLKAMAKDPDDRYPSAAEFAAALRSIDVAGDDAVPLVVRDPTPPAGAPQVFHQSERTWLVPAAVIVGTAIVLIALALALGGTDVGRGLLDRRPGASATSGRDLAITNVGVIDPTDGQEKNERLPFITDDDDATSWETSRYNSQDFGGLKPHLGLQLELAERATIRRVTVTSPTSGWDVELYVADQSSSDPERWGRAVARRQGVNGTATFDDLDAAGRYVLVLFTRLGSDNRIEVQRVRITS